LSLRPAFEPQCVEPGGAVELLIEARTRDLGELEVRRVLPAAQRRMVGPFVFFDHMGPAEFADGQGMAVRPHPHIGLATITYLFEGSIMHRDSLGYVQPIEAGAVNLMTAGRGIVHSERAPDLTSRRRLHGIQSWTALPTALEETEPAFTHYPAALLPELERGGATVRVIMGSAFGAVSPVELHSPALYLEARLEAGARFAPPQDCSERAVYIVEGRAAIGPTPLCAGAMAVLRTGAAAVIEAQSACRIMVIGGEPVGPRHIWWNFVASSPARIERAKDDWRDGRFGTVPGDDEFIPLPER
jgi:redox-sensitive bicupin YhaK (pirin superfamily)